MDSSDSRTHRAAPAPHGSGSGPPRRAGGRPLRQTAGPETALGPLEPGLGPSWGASAAAEVAQPVVGMPLPPGGHRYTQRRSPALRPHTYLPAIRDSVCGSGATPRARYDATSGERGSLGPESRVPACRARRAEGDGSKGRKSLVGGTAWRAGGRLVAWAHGFRRPDSRSAGRSEEWRGGVSERLLRAQVLR